MIINPTNHHYFQLKEQEHSDNMLAPIVIGAIATVTLIHSLYIIIYESDFE